MLQGDGGDGCVLEDFHHGRRQGRLALDVCLIGIDGGNVNIMLLSPVELCQNTDGFVAVLRNVIMDMH
jgi:hypothetical protein